jgi:hypothetical protein
MCLAFSCSTQQCNVPDDTDFIDHRGASVVADLSVTGLTATSVFGDSKVWVSVNNGIANSLGVPVGHVKIISVIQTLSELTLEFEVTTHSSDAAVVEEMETRIVVQAPTFASSIQAVAATFNVSHELKDLLVNYESITTTHGVFYELAAGANATVARAPPSTAPTPVPTPVPTRAPTTLAPTPAAAAIPFPAMVPSTLEIEMTMKGFYLYGTTNDVHNDDFVLDRKGYSPFDRFAKSHWRQAVATRLKNSQVSPLLTAEIDPEAVTILTVVDCDVGIEIAFQVQLPSIPAPTQAPVELGSTVGSGSGSGSDPASTPSASAPPDFEPITAASIAALTAVLSSDPIPGAGAALSDPDPGAQPSGSELLFGVFKVAMQASGRSVSPQAAITAMDTQVDFVGGYGGYVRLRLGIKLASKIIYGLGIDGNGYATQTQASLLPSLGRAVTTTAGQRESAVVWTASRHVCGHMNSSDASYQFLRCNATAEFVLPAANYEDATGIVNEVGVQYVFQHLHFNSKLLV